ncbi:fibronectin type-III domain-containing protein 3A-like isoform X1 [Antechinus flavipes]|uniref:fibronectin type-III domain-containing protein 3A-like isoform X1 n=1 Tax=Antechinus flavipes TaxID=38775 RepID=UPI0022362935|nr:fibronectin type-III domain-containing protein 3A-like isoform X1 [Antechinus flavipes]XP_051823919.1 fibronectin type-III domain-containing protein 3A-like isoform X1 [Antechinus flavipes]XP_051823920.1 fibronectin type-III domain-containing protein 3A-like isoform X1 [Antechinus flavipes]XP_051823921.1 fibronectin type-III domain-containing protein 3A-like isoform X1 [Antechinus flavipes]
MAEQVPALEPTPVMNDMPLPPHMVNGDSMQQVILVQVNPGETFTIRTEDGHVQCIQGPAHVPMMSLNGSMPPIFVPPGYMSQVVEENGVRKIVILPHSTEYHPSMHPPPHLQHYMHPHPPPMLAHPPHPMYPPVPGSELHPPQYMHQHAMPPPPPPPPPLPQPRIYHEYESRSHGRTHYIPRDERTGKMQEHLKKRIKDRHAIGHNNNNNKSGIPPSSLSKVHSSYNANVENGYGKGHYVVEEPVKQKQSGKAKDSPAEGAKAEEPQKEIKELQDLFSTGKPIVSNIQARSAVLSWSHLVNSQNEENANRPVSFTFEVALSNCGKSGKFKTIYIGDEVTVSLPDLQPATDYHVRVSATYSSIEESTSEVISFTTESCEPDRPAVPKLVNRTKNSLILQWKGTNDNGSKIISFLLEWDEGKPGTFKECYFGHLKQYKLTKLSPSTRYSFRLAAKNNLGISEFSETVAFNTTGSVPPAPPPPQLNQAGITTLSLEWSPPAAAATGESHLTYTLEMEEEGSGHGFKAKYNGEDPSCTLKNLRRSTSYKFRLFAHNSEGKSNPSEEVEYTTYPDKPGPPSKPYTKGKIRAYNVKVAWDPPKDNGGAEISKYVLELSEAPNGSIWNVIYDGTLREHVCDHLRPGTSYKLRVYCVGIAGQSQASDILSIHTSAVPPGPCRSPYLANRAKPREISLHWAPPVVNGGAEIIDYVVDMAESDQAECRRVYQGPGLRCTVSNLLPGRTYNFWIKAANKTGFGPYSAKSQISTAPGPPDQCGIPLLTCKTATSVAVSWEVPMCNGAEICDYRLEWGKLEGAMHVIYTGPCLNYEVKGLTPATTYFCRVQAVNMAGIGMFGGTGIVTTPASVPGAMALPRLLEGKIPLPLASTCLALQWDEPNCHGSEITGYNIEYGDRQIVTVDRVTSYTLENLQPDTVYRIRIQAFNSLGQSPFSQSIKAKTKPLPPDPPVLECVCFSYQSLKLKWGDGPNRISLSNTIHFNLQMEDKTGRFVTLLNGPCHTYKVQRLSECTTYNFKIQAYNESGEGPFSEIYTFTTTKSPPAPLKAPKISQLGENLCEVTWDPLPPIKGDSIVYILQLLSGRGADQVYKGPDTSFCFTNFQTNCEYRFRVCAGRQYQQNGALQELLGAYSPSTVFASEKKEIDPPQDDTTAEIKNNKRCLTDDQFAFILVVAFAVIAVLCAVAIQYFLIK